MDIMLLALCLLAVGAWLFYAYRDDQSLAWAVRVFIVLSSGVVAVVIAWVTAFALYKVPSTTSGLTEVAKWVLPIAGGFGCLSACLLLYRGARRRRHAGGRHPTGGLSQ
jgi:hypothetical protein